LLGSVVLDWNDLEGVILGLSLSGIILALTLGKIGWDIRGMMRHDQKGKRDPSASRDHHPE